MQAFYFSNTCIKVHSVPTSWAFLCISQTIHASMAPPLPLLSCPITLDSRYFVVRGQLWRIANPELPEDECAVLVADLMLARREVGKELRGKDLNAKRQARQAVEAAKSGLGERGPSWWSDGAPDYNRCIVRNTPYA